MTRAQTTTGERPWLPSRLRALESAEPTLLLLRASLLVLLVNSNNDLATFVGVALVCVVALPNPRLLHSPWFWGALFVLVGARQLATWNLHDDHVVVTTYWCGAIALGLTARDRTATLAASARFLVGTLFAAAAAWKLFSGEFIDGTFFRYSLLFDGRFETTARLFGGTSPGALAANHDALQALDAAGGVGPIVLDEGPRNALVAAAFTGWGALIESFVAVTFLVPLRQRWCWLRHGTLVAFAVTTYLIVPVAGFGALLFVLGAAQAVGPRLRSAYYVGAAALLLWGGIWPSLFS